MDDMDLNVQMDIISI